MLHKCLFLLMTAVLLFASPAQAENLWTVPDGSFAKIPVMHKGRIKPLDSFARAQLKQFSNETDLGDDRNAVSWLASTIFSPYDAMQEPLFLIRHPELKNMLALEKRKGHLYSFSEINSELSKQRETILKLMQTRTEDWTPAQQQLVTLQRNVHSFQQLLNSVSLLLPLAFNVPDELKAQLPKDKTPTFLDLMAISEALREKVQSINKDKGTALETYTQDEMTYVNMAFAFEKIAQQGQASLVFRVIPSIWDGTPSWHSPWQTLNAGHGSPATAEIMSLWSDLAKAYHSGNPQTWNEAADALYQKTEPLVSSFKLDLEITYNRSEPTHKSAMFYIAAFLMLVVSLLISRGHMTRQVSMWLLLFGTVFHTLAIVSRMTILERPPVGTLYESILFVGLICVLSGLFMERVKKDNIGLFISSISGALLGILAITNIGGESEMGVLVAVLNTNFWLTTHVICITIGYAFCILTALLAHLLLYLKLGNKIEQSKKLFPVMHKMSLLALLFASAGTILGGIWADQSWGRFWGWDPKENGALLIILWLMWVLHGKLSGHMNRIDFTAGMAALNIIVALSWFGVNLLNVGLHSYGFIDSVAWGLAGFCSAEILIIAYPYLRLRKGKQHEA